MGNVLLLVFSCLQGDGPLTGGLISVGKGAYKQEFIVQSPKLDLTTSFHMKLFAYIFLNSRLNYSNAFLL